MNFQMFKSDFERAEEPEVKLPTSVGSSKKQEFQKISTSVLLTMPKPLTVWMTANCGKFFEMGIPDHLTPEKSVCRSRSNSKNWTWNNRLVPKRKRRMSRLYIVTLLI